MRLALTILLLFAFGGVMLLGLRSALIAYRSPADWRFVGRTSASDNFTKRIAIGSLISIPILWLLVSLEIVRAMERASPLTE